MDLYWSRLIQSRFNFKLWLPGISTKFTFRAVLAQLLKLNFITSNENECSPVLPCDLAMAMKFTSKQEQKNVVASLSCEIQLFCRYFSYLSKNSDIKRIEGRKWTELLNWVSNIWVVQSICPKYSNFSSLPRNVRVRSLIRKFCYSSIH